MRQTKLHEWHVRAGARMLEFGGWDMPVLYAAGPREEHLRVRAAAGLFDIDHMGRFEISGPGALGFLQRIQTWDAAGLAAGHAHYSMLCMESGGIIDDIFLYRLAYRLADRWLMVVNASNAAKDLAWLQSHATGFDVAIRDISPETCMIALQGPASRAILQSLCSADLSSFAYHGVAECEVTGAPAALCSSGRSLPLSTVTRSASRPTRTARGSRQRPCAWRATISSASPPSRASRRLRSSGALSVSK